MVIIYLPAYLPTADMFLSPTERELDPLLEIQTPLSDEPLVPSQSSHVHVS
jgi:hypothetical protein